MYNIVVRYFILLCLLWSTAINASPVSHTGGARVEKGRLSTEARVGISFDDASARQDNRVFTRQHIDYGFTDYYALRIGWNQQKADNDNLQHSDVRIENRFQFYKQKKHGFDFGARLSYVHNSGQRAGKARFRLLGQLDVIPRWTLRGNIFFKHDVGENAQDGLDMDIRTQLMHRLAYQNDYILASRAGIELFNDIGRLDRGYSRQLHSAGFVVNLGHPHDLYTVFAYHRGISNAHPDDTFKFALRRVF